jgi:alpha-galactosidase
MSGLHLRSAETDFIVRCDGDRAGVTHWGRPLAAPPEPAMLEGAVAPSSHDDPFRLDLVPQATAGWRGMPGLSGHRAGGGFSPAFRDFRVTQEADSAGEIRAIDPLLELSIVTEVGLSTGGLLRIRHTLVNEGADQFALDKLAIQLPLPDYATEIFDLAGRWTREQHPQRLPLRQGSWVRSSRHGRTGHDAPLLTAVGVPGFGFRHGEVWGVHLGWSGNHESIVERTSDPQTVIGAAELLAPGELTLAPGQQYRTPWLFAAHSATGLDGLAAAFHGWVRARPNHPSTSRPVVLNSWEAVYFRHDLDELKSIVDVGARVGVERFVLDDGWFAGRRDDRVGLGDWTVDAESWPHGLGPLIEHVRGSGMQFGLWVEPEMVNADSDLARAHPDWIATSDSRRTPATWRHQQVLDLVNPLAWDHIFRSLDLLLREYRIDYLKWDQNRDLLDLGHDGLPSTHEQTLAVYRLLDTLREAHPTVEIESCSSGGGRVDLGILERTDRIWASDTNDPLERATIQRFTELVVPPELVGAHIGPPKSHTTGRTHTLAFRVITAMFGHLGIEWDLRDLSESEVDEFAAAVALYKRYRPLIHSGTMVNADLPQSSLMVRGVVSADRAEALFTVSSLTTSSSERPGPVRLPGLDRTARYRVALEYPLTAEPFLQRDAPPWIDAGFVVPADVLELVGLPMPILMPEQALLISLVQDPIEGHAHA